MPPKKRKPVSSSPRVAHINFNVEKERSFLKYVKYLSNPLHIMWRNFLVGAFQGLGFILGSALLLAIIGFITSKVLINIPFISDFGQAINLWLESTLDTQQ